jgi:hypothetical protein
MTRQAGSAYRGHATRCSFRKRLRRALRREPAPERRLLHRSRRGARAASRCRSRSARAARSSRSTTSSTWTPPRGRARVHRGPAAVVVKHTNPCGVAARPRWRGLPHRPRGRLAERLRWHRRAQPARGSRHGRRAGRDVPRVRHRPRLRRRGPRQAQEEGQPAHPRHGRLAPGPITARCTTSASAAAWWCRTATPRVAPRCATARWSASGNPRPTSGPRSSSRGACAST